MRGCGYYEKAISLCDELSKKSDLNTHFNSCDATYFPNALDWLKKNNIPNFPMTHRTSPFCLYSI